METWLVVCLVLAAMGILITRDYPEIESMLAGLFAGLMMVFLYPLMPLVAKGIVVTSTLSTTLLTTETLIQGMGWLVVLFPVPVFFLAYLRHIPMKVFTLFISALIFTLWYSAVLEVVIFRSVWTMILLNFLVLPVVFLSMYGFGWAIRGYRYIVAFLLDNADYEAAQGMKGTKGYHQQA